MDISAHAFSLADRPQRAIRVTSVRMRREDRSSISSYSSRRPRLETVDSVTSSLAPHIAQFLCSSQWPFLRPGLQTSIASRAGAVKAGRHAWLAAGSGVLWGAGGHREAAAPTPCNVQLPLRLLETLSLSCP